MTDQEAIANALQLHPDCTYARADLGLSVWLEPTWQVNLWRNEECYLAGDPVRHVESGYIRDGHAMLDPREVP